MLTRIIGSLNLAGLVLLSAIEVLGSPESLGVPNPMMRSQSRQEAGNALQTQDQSPKAPIPNLTDAGASGGVPPNTAVSQDSGKIIDSNYRLNRLKEWRMAVAQHDPGKPDPAAVRIGKWKTKDLEIVVDLLTKWASQPADSARRTLAKASIRRLVQLTDQEAQQGSLNRILKLGALLHTDIALLGLETADPQYPSEGMGAFADGRLILQPTTFHWEFARRLIDAVSSRPSPDPMVRQWYVATTAHLQSLRLLGYSGQNLKHALAKFPSDDRILFYAGALHEIRASPVNQNALLPSVAKINYGSKESELNLARQFYRKVIAENPGFDEAHLRLGRAMGLLGDHPQAVVELQYAAASIKDRQLLYYTALFLGYEFAMLSRTGDARDQYERAAALYPTAQSPLLALSQLARSNNDIAGALLALQRVFALPRRDPWQDDPWWIYDIAHVRDAAGLVAEMRRMFGELPR